MATTCQHCGATTDDDARVMCPQCRRRMRPVAATGDAPAGGLDPGPAPTAHVAGVPPYAPGSQYAPASPYATPTAIPYATPRADPSDQPPGVDVDFNRRVVDRTSRLTVAFRLLLAVPHLVALAFLTLAAELLAVVAWFSSLFIGRVPTDLYAAIGWVVAYGTRVWSYLFLLTDTWPRFSETPGDPVQVRRPGPGRLNRAAILFRLVLATPAAILAQLVATGVIVVSPIAWLVTLVLGRVPQPVFDAIASAARYQARYFAYSGLLTARYPGGLFGGHDEPREISVEQSAPSSGPPVMTRGARLVMTVLIVVGVLGVAGEIAADSATGADVGKAQTADAALTDAYQSMHMSSAGACLGAPDEIACVRENARQDASTFRTFAEDLSGIEFPNDGGIGRDVDHLRSVTRVFIADLDALSNAASLQDYQRIATDGHLDLVGTDFDTAVHTLDEDLQAYASGP